MRTVQRAVFADQFPAGADLEQAARDSLIRYVRHFGLRIVGGVTVQWGSMWQLEGRYWRCRLDVPSVRAWAEVEPA